MPEWSWLPTSFSHPLATTVVRSTDFLPFGAVPHLMGKPITILDRGWENPSSLSFHTVKVTFSRVCTDKTH